MHEKFMKLKLLLKADIEQEDTILFIDADSDSISSSITTAIPLKSSFTSMNVYFPSETKLTTKFAPESFLSEDKSA